MIKSKWIKFITGTVLTVIILVAAGILFYVKGLPAIVSNPKVIHRVEKYAQEYLTADLKIDNPVLHTELSPNIDFSVDNLYLQKSGKKLLELNKFKSAFSLAGIFRKTLIIKKLVAKNIYVDADEILTLIPQTEKKEEKPSEWKFDIYDALLGVRKVEIIYTVQPQTKLRLLGERIGVNNANKGKRNVFFQLKAIVTRKDKSVTLKLNDNKRVFFNNEIFYVENCPFGINNSNIFINLQADKKREFDIDLFAKNLNINDILDFLNTQIIENNVAETLAYFDNIKGSIDFNFNIKGDKYKGKFNLNDLSFRVIPVNNLPVRLTKGTVTLDTKEVKLDGFEGFYDNDKRNKMDFKGTVKDYLKTIDTDLVGNAVVRSPFFKNHLTKMTGTKLDLVGEAPTRVMLKSKNNIMDIVWLFMLKPGQNIKVADDFLPFEKNLRAMSAKMHLENMILDITSMDYYIAPEGVRPSGQRKHDPNRKRPDPIFRLSSRVDLANNNRIDFIGFEIPNPLPSEFLNVILKQNLFKKGKIGGKLTIDNSGSYPVLDGSLNMDRVLIPSQKMFIKSALLDAKDKLINLSANGGYRRAKFDFSGELLNEIKFPIVVKDTKLSLGNVDLHQLLEYSTGNKASEDNVIATDSGNVKVEADGSDFDISNLIIEKGLFHLDKGTYKDIEFANIDADLSLNKDGILDIKSNRFDIAEGKSSLKVNCDLKQQKYNVWLGILGVNSNTMAKSLLDLDGEISGKAGGLIDISTDKSMKLSGNIKFYVSEGKIEKVGLVEYVLKFAALFRNPITMVSPGIFADILNVPKGEFEKITGTVELKDNVARMIRIKSYSSQLSTYITGRYNLDNKDTSLRIYTKFSSSRKKGLAGFLRNLSLNSIATRIPFSSRNDVNYYELELKELPEIEADEKDCQIFLTKVEGDVEHNNYISMLKKIK
ncbi:MAG: hypothetical protein VZR09_05490 [Candidatus Gastranaerophilaceae bacterium]|nr:hypothetical protein [Candidatus Gastranaerophilaceae bacterium]